MTREAIYAAIFARIVALKSNSTIVDCSRKLIHWEDLAASQMPFVVQMQQPEQGDYKLNSGVPTKWSGKVLLLVYVNTAGDSSLVPASVMNVVIDAIENSFGPLDANGNYRDGVVDNRDTLGGLVKDIRVFGALELDDGSQSNQAVAVIPVEFLA